MKDNYIDQSKAIGYVRSAAQDSDSEKSLLEQVFRIRDVGVKTLIYDFASASDDDRQGLKILLKLAKEGKIREVVVTRWDRLARSSKLYFELVAVFRASNIRILSLDQGEIHFPIKGGALWNFLNSIFQKQNCQSNNCNSPVSDSSDAKEQTTKSHESHVLGYWRVSSREQAENSCALEQQEEL